jgi:hypothetical protein
MNTDAKIGLAILTTGALIIGIMFWVHWILEPKPLTDSEILTQVEACNRMGRIANAAQNDDGDITRIRCGMPPYQDKRNAF